jgi:hypothetical protein
MFDIVDKSHGCLGIIKGDHPALVHLAQVAAAETAQHQGYRQAGYESPPATFLTHQLSPFQIINPTGYFASAI